MEKYTLVYCMQLDSCNWVYLFNHPVGLEDTIRKLTDKPILYQGENFILVELIKKGGTKTIWLAKDNSSVYVKLNDNFTAKVTARGVEVGCENFSFRVIENLYLAVQEQKNKLYK